MLWPNGTKTRPTITSGFGPRDPGAGSTYHRGTDFVGFSAVRAIAAGTVRVAGTPSGWGAGGNQVWIEHDGYFTRYLHLASMGVQVGQTVQEGAVIGVMGNTGGNYGVHLHLEVTPGTLHYSNTGQVDPVPFITSRLQEDELTPAQAAQLAQIAADVNWLKTRVGGVHTGATLADEIRWLKDRVGGSYTGPTITDDLGRIKVKLGA